jgi:hypothetical protein
MDELEPTQVTRKLTELDHGARGDGEVGRAGTGESGVSRK